MALVLDVTRNRIWIKIFGIQPLWFQRFWININMKCSDDSEISISYSFQYTILMPDYKYNLIPMRFHTNKIAKFFFFFDK